MRRLFGKKKQQTTIAELEEYYANQSQRKNRPWKAWLMALLSLLITVAVIIGLFLGGRWLYRTFVDDNNTSSTTSESTDDGINLPSFDGEFGENSSSSSSEQSDSSSDASNGAIGESTESSDSATDNSSTNSSEGVVTDEAASTTESNADRIASTGPGEDELPNTGAGEILVVAPIAAAVAGYLFSRKRQLK